MAGPVVVGLGDSVSSGLGDSVLEGATPGWVSHLAALLGGPDPVLFAEVGARVDDVLDRQLPLALEQHPDLATVLVGGNDVLRRGFDPPALGDRLGAGCLTLVDAGIVVVVVLLHDPARTLPLRSAGLGPALGSRAAQLNDEVRAHLLGAPGVVLVDLESSESAHRRRLWHFDRMHPSPLGHRYLAAVAARRLEAYGLPVPGRVLPYGDQASGVRGTARWAFGEAVPWVGRRWSDLIPEIAMVVQEERRARRSD